MKVFSKEVIKEENDVLCGYVPVCVELGGLLGVIKVGHLDPVKKMFLMRDYHVTADELIAIGKWVKERELEQERLEEFPRPVPEAEFNYNLGVVNV